jgi:hypothetical protein
VDVIVCDVYSDPARCIRTAVHDLDTLKQHCSLDHASNDVGMRLLLVEDMTAPVVEILGAALRCHPQLFEEHMRTIGYRNESDFDRHGRLSRHEVQVLTQNTEDPVPISQYKEKLHFSLPFCRSFEYDSEEAQKAHEAKRTMWRKYDNDETRLEERVSGVVYTPLHLKHSVG